jgi:hypothetical protein
MAANRQEIVFLKEKSRALATSTKISMKIPAQARRAESEVDQFRKPYVKTIAPGIVRDLRICDSAIESSFAYKVLKAIIKYQTDTTRGRGGRLTRRDYSESADLKRR